MNPNINSSDSSAPLSEQVSNRQFLEEIKKVWEVLPRSALILYVLLMCGLYQTAYWEQLGVDFLEHITITEAAGRCVFPISAVFLFLLFFLSPSKSGRPEWRLNLSNGLHRAVHITMRFVAAICAAALFWIDVTSADFSPKSFILTTFPAVLLFIVLIAVPSTEKAQLAVSRFRYLRVSLLVFFSVILSAGSGKLVGAFRLLSNQKPEVVFVDKDLALRLSLYRYVDTIGKVHIFTLAYPSRKTALVNSDQVRAIILRPSAYNPRQIEDAERDKAGEEQYVLALNLLSGRSNVTDEKQGFEYLSKAANAGNVSAAYLLALCYKDGDTGVPADPKLYLHWLRRAADGGSADAQFLLGLVCLKGDIVPLDEEAGFKWIYKAGVAGNKDAQKFIPLLYGAGKSTQVNMLKANAWRIVIGEVKDLSAIDAEPSEEQLSALKKEVASIRQEIANHQGQAK
jgi:hypothetical protein